MIKNIGIHSHEVAIGKLEEAVSTLRRARDSDQIQLLSKQIFYELEKNKNFLSSHFKRNYFRVQFTKQRTYQVLERYKNLCDATKDQPFHAPLRTMIAQGIEVFVQDYGMLSSIDILPNEIILMIIKDLDYSDLMKFSLVCRRFYHLVSDDVIWRKIAEKCALPPITADSAVKGQVKEGFKGIWESVRDLVLFKQRVESGLTDTRVRYKGPDELLQHGYTFSSWVEERKDHFLRFTRLSLGAMNLKQLPAEIRFFIPLRSLDLSFNCLKTLPPQIDHLIYMKVLHACYNQLQELPEEMGNLHALTELNLTSNKLTALPSTLSRMTALKILLLTKNELSLLPQGMARLTKLEKLDVSNNRLEALPPEIGHLQLLQNLNLRRNRITELPSSFTLLSALQTLHIAFNPLQFNPDPPLRLPLASLSIDKTQFAYCYPFINSAGKACKLKIELDPC